MEVTVAITPIETSRTIQGTEISYVNVPSGLDISRERKLVDITVKGKQLDLDRMRTNSCSASADCSVATGPGVTDVPVFIQLPNNIKLDSQTIENLPVTFFTEKPVEDAASETADPDNYYFD